jgi:hypothetical protein
MRWGEEKVLRSSNNNPTGLSVKNGGLQAGIVFGFPRSPFTSLFLRSTNLETQLFTTVIKVSVIIFWIFEHHSPGLPRSELLATVYD